MLEPLFTAGACILLNSHRLAKKAEEHTEYPVRSALFSHTGRSANRFVEEGLIYGTMQVNLH